MSASAFDIAASGMAAHRAEMDVIAANIANAETSRADGQPYRSRTAVFEAAPSAPFADALNDAAGAFAVAEPDEFTGDSDGELPQGIRFAGTVESTEAPRFRYDPGNPFAIAAGARRGFVAEPDVDPIEQMVSLVSAGRAYDADVAALQAAKQMDVEAVDVDRP